MAVAGVGAKSGLEAPLAGLGESPPLGGLSRLSLCCQSGLAQHPLSGYLTPGLPLWEKKGFHMYATVQAASARLASSHGNSVWGIDFLGPGHLVSTIWHLSRWSWSGLKDDHMSEGDPLGGLPRTPVLHTCSCG